MTEPGLLPALSPTGDTDRPSSPVASFEAAEETRRAHQDTTEWLEETVERSEETPQETTEETTSGWDGVETAAVILVIGVLTAACGWSAIALHGLAQQAGTTSWLAWGAPIIVDGPLFQSAIALVVLKRRAKNHVPVEPRFRRFFWWTLAASELVSLIGNGAHAAKIPVTPTIAAVIAGAAPVAAMAVMHGFTILIEVPRKPEPITQTADAERTTRTPHLGAIPEPSPVASPGDAVTSPAVSWSSPEDPRGDTEETQPVSCPSPGDDRGDAEPVSQETIVCPEDRDASIWAMHLEGKPLREIAETMDLSKGYVGKILARLKAGNNDASGDDGAEVVLQLVR
ncbi:DUF2637 domain-containing protein [Nocardia niigatensis]